jgi:adenine-specific DNA-methyltransferase
LADGDAYGAGLLRMTKQKLLNQYFTPRWVAEEVVARHLGHLQPGATVVEPSCGDGRFLLALPDHVHAIGVEIDPHWAEIARRASGREILVGDFLHVPLPTDVDAIVGNPPFKASIVAGFLDRSHGLLRDGGKCCLILPAYLMQTSTKVLEMARKWSISQELMPRNVFPRLSVPIILATFTKEQERRLFGFFLYREAADIGALPSAVRATLAGDLGGDAVSGARAGSVWRSAVNGAFDAMEADQAPLDAIYRAIEGRRPTANRHYHAKVRQVLQTYPEFEPLERGLWARRSGCTVRRDGLFRMSA